MKRTMLTIVVACGLAAPVPPTRGEPAKPVVTVPAADRAALEKTLQRCFQALPVPSRGFMRDRESGWTEIVPHSGGSDGPRIARPPAEAAAARVFERAIAGEDESDAFVLEIRVYLNRERSLPEPLGSEGGSIEGFTHDGMPGMRIYLAGVEPARVALPLTPAEKDDALSVVRLHVGVPEIEPYLVDIAQGRRPVRSPWDATVAKRASEVRTIVVEYRGPRGEVERLVQATAAAKLRALLTEG